MNAQTFQSLALIVWLLLLHTLNTPAASPKFDEEKLRSLLKLPKMKVEFGFSVTSDLGFTLNDEPLDLALVKPAAEKIADLRKKIKGDVGDARRYLDLANLYSKAGDEAQSKAALKRATELFRSQAKTNPRDGWTRAQLGAALIAADQQAEGEELLRAATSLTPEDWRCWSQLGGFRMAQAFQTLGITNRQTLGQNLPNPAPSSPRSASTISATQRAEGRQRWEEAIGCFDKAVAAAPQEVKTYQARAGHRMNYGMLLQPLLEPDTARNQEPAELMRRWLQPVAADIKRAADLSPDDPYGIGTAIFFEMMPYLGESDGANLAGKNGLAAALPNPVRDHVQDGLARLEELARRRDENIAGGACAALAGLQFLLFHDLPNAERNIRRAVALRPAAERTRELLWALYIDAQRWQDLAANCEEQLRVKNSVQTRLTLAKAYERLEKPARVEEQIQAALSLEPQNVLLNIASIALQLKRARAGMELERVGERIRQFEMSSFKSAPRDSQDSFEFVHGIYFALIGDRDQASRHFRILLANDPSDTNYQAAYGALGR